MCNIFYGTVKTNEENVRNKEAYYKMNSETVIADATRNLPETRVEGESKGTYVNFTETKMDQGSDPSQIIADNYMRYVLGFRKGTIQAHPFTCWENALRDYKKYIRERIDANVEESEKRTGKDDYIRHIVMPKLYIVKKNRTTNQLEELGKQLREDQSLTEYALQRGYDSVSGVTNTKYKADPVMFWTLLIRKEQN